MICSKKETYFQLILCRLVLYYQGKGSNMESISIQEPDKKPPALERAGEKSLTGRVRIELTKGQGTAPPSTVLKTAGLTQIPFYPHVTARLY